MFCPFCGNENRGGKKFCRQCGKQIPVPRARAMEAGVDAGSSDPRFGVGNRGGYSPPYKSKSPEPQTPQADVPTAQFPHDEDKFEVSSAQPPPASPVSGNSSERPLNGGPSLAPIAMEMPAIPKIFLPEEPFQYQERIEEYRLDDTPYSIPVEPPPGPNSGELTSTDELEVLDKTIEPPLLSAAADASAERPAESFLQGDASGISGSDSTKASRPFGFLSFYRSGEGESLEHRLRVERMIVAIAALCAIAGLSLIIWFLVFR